MLKKYIANSQVSLTVNFANGGHKHISFSQITGGGSIYYSNDESEQEALESHAKFGRLFRMEPVEEVKQAPVEAVADETPKVEATNSKIVLPMACLEDAKDYLCDKFGLSRTKLRSRKAILDAAESKNIEFTGI